MAAVNEAYEVLSSPGMPVTPCSPQQPLTRVHAFAELRARFDNGDDPNDPTSGQQGGRPFPGGGHPFQHVFFQHGGPFQRGNNFQGGQFQFEWS